MEEVAVVKEVAPIPTICDPNPDSASDMDAANYEDITSFVTSSLLKAPAGHTFLAPGFTMEDAMHGWEVLSPKMDAGVGYANTFLAEEATLPQMLQPDELLGVIDKMMGLELVLYRGYCSVHTIET
jgi:hypothetical protein